MYRIVCESYINYMNDFKEKDKDNYRYQVMLPLGLIMDLEQYKKEKAKETLRYKKLEDFIWYVKKYIHNYQCFKAFLWILESRGIKGQYYGVSTEEELIEQIKTTKMFLKLSYWN